MRVSIISVKQTHNDILNRAYRALKVSHNDTYVHNPHNLKNFSWGWGGGGKRGHDLIIFMSTQHAMMCNYIHHTHYITSGEKRWFLQAKVGSRFSGLALREVPYGPYKDAVVVEVSGKANYTGESSFWCEEGDDLSAGFLLK